MSHIPTSVQSLMQQRILLEIEYNCEKELFRRQTELVGIQKKVKRGDAWFPIRIGKSYYNSLNQLAVEIFQTSDSDIEHNFEYNRPVCFFTIHNGSIKYLSINGTVSYAESNRMVVTVPDNNSLGELQRTEHIGVQLFFDETSYRMMLEALDRTINAKNNRLAYLRDLFYSQQKAQTFTFAAIRFPWLNSTQEQAVNNVLRSKDVAIVHGPPGTGKTTTLVEAIYETLHRESQVLVCAQSNMAVDWISEKLVDRGINVLRIGNPSRVNEKMLSFTYERRFENHPDYPLLWTIRKTIREMRQNRSKRSTENYHQKIERLKSRATEIEIRINAELFGEARVIACTLVGAASRVLSGMKFATLFIDEAAQALEAACWIPIRKVSRVVLAGDHCQLPPTVKSIAAAKGGLAKTLMERLTENKPEAVNLLKVQYRMNDSIMRFSSEWFYNGELESAPITKHRGILDYDSPIDWIDTSQMAIEKENCEEEGQSIHFREQFVGENFGRINKDEAQLTLDTLLAYFNKIGKERVLSERIDIGIISPYRAQVQYLRQRIRKKDVFKPYRHLITVNTIDGFQGQERDIILISMVRANEDGQIGFLKDLRRMNVAMTRARMKLIILGDAPTLTKHPFYKKLLGYIKETKEREFY